MSNIPTSVLVFWHRVAGCSMSRERPGLIAFSVTLVPHGMMFIQRIRVLSTSSDMFHPDSASMCQHHTLLSSFLKFRCSRHYYSNMRAATEVNLQRRRLRSVWVCTRLSNMKWSRVYEDIPL